MLFTFKFEKLEQANDEVIATTYYGGSFELNGKEYLASGSDRDSRLHGTMRRAIEEFLGREVSEEERMKLESPECEAVYVYLQDGSFEL